MSLDLAAWPRERALALMQEYTQSEALRRHMYAVEVAMRAMAERAGEDPEPWGLVGLLHDFDYERWPNPEHAPDREHPAEGVRLLTAQGFPEPLGRAILGHATYSGVPRDTAIAVALFAVDEPRRSGGVERQEEAQGQGLRTRCKPGRRAARGRGAGRTAR
jgi:putative nucleotidyltransferase with HDIG domain